jgi:Zn finger protein HypA/HybF involved in hydrogenase expression
MHTHSRLSSIVRQILRQSARPEVVRIAIGELLLEENELRRQWKALVSQTPLAETRLSIRVIPAEQQCMTCFLKYHPQHKETACPQCGSVGAKILSGEEFYLELD